MKKIFSRVFGSIGRVVSRLTAPVRDTSVWKWLRRHVLKSPFRGYFVASFKEVRKVTWPDRKTTWKLTGVVALFTIVFAIFTTVLDYGFEKLARELFLN